ncbi:MAG: ATP-binding protein [Actinomycetaceae bacterium]|nr:ATP-binding protein [Actinomycetaceae bacterium]
MTASITRVQVFGYRRFRDFTFEPEQGASNVVGGNEAGKSTLLEAMTLALSGRVGGVRATEYLNPYWFNSTIVHDFFEKPPSERRLGWSVHLGTS